MLYFKGVKRRYYGVNGQPEPTLWTSIQCFTITISRFNCENAGSFMSAQILLNLLNEYGKRDKM